MCAVFFLFAHKHHISYWPSLRLNFASSSWASGFLLPKGGDLHLIEPHESVFVYPSVSVWFWKAIKALLEHLFLEKLSGNKEAVSASQYLWW